MQSCSRMVSLRWTSKAFMVDSAHANENFMRKVSGDGNPTVPLKGRKLTCILYWSTSVDKITKIHIKPLL